jgi:LysR family transcriptional activator of nhaA
MARLNYHHLYYFWSVAKEGNLTRAAEQLHVSQSALSAQIRQLEAQMGHALFQRQGRSLQLTESGHLALGYAESIFALGTELEDALSSESGHQVKRLRVGSISTLSRNFQENFLRPIIGVPDIQLTLEAGRLEDLLQRLAVFKLDLVLSNNAVATDSESGWRCRRIARQPVCLIGAPRLRSKRFVFPDDLRSARVLLPGTGSEVRTQFELLCEELEIKVSILAEVDDMAMLRLLARDSGGIALLPPVVVQDELKSGQLQEYCVVPKVHETFYAVTSARKHQPALLRTLLANATPLQEQS